MPIYWCGGDREGANAKMQHEVMFRYIRGYNTISYSKKGINPTGANMDTVF